MGGSTMGGSTMGGNMMGGNTTGGTPATGMCGDGMIDFGEGCDDGNTVSGDGCSSVCLTEDQGCGDGIIDFGESCDDGNTVSGDGCSSICLLEESLCDDDLWEENDQIEESVLFDVGQSQDLISCPNDADYFRIQGCRGGQLSIRATPTSITDDIDIRLTYFDNRLISMSNEIGGVADEISHTFSAREEVYLKVYGFLEQRYSYQLEVDLTSCLDDLPCMDVSQCPSGQVCQNQICLIPSPFDDCMDESECMNGDLCIDGTCQTPSLDCMDDMDCPEEQICFEGACQMPPPDCIVDADCGPNEVCNNTLCEPESPIACTFDFECQDGNLCIEEVCTPNPLNCQDNMDCMNGQECVDNLCQDPMPECLVDTECEANEVCSAGVCQEQDPTLSCTEDADCGQYEVCFESQCFEQPVHECTADFECSLFSECGSDSQCTPSLTNGDDWQEDNDSRDDPKTLFLDEYTGLVAVLGDEDWYTTTLCAGGTLTSHLIFDGDDGDLDYYLYVDEETLYETRGFTVTDNETLSYTNDTANEQTMYLRVKPYRGSATPYHLYYFITDCNNGSSPN
jgi:cysteine-rich repeat protein